MNTTINSLTALALSASLICAQGAGPLNPPGPPADGTYRTLQELWDKLGTVEASNTALSADVQALLATVQSLSSTVADQSTLIDNLSQNVIEQTTFLSSLIGSQGIRINFATENVGIIVLVPNDSGHPSLAYSPTTGEPSIVYKSETSFDAGGSRPNDNGWIRLATRNSGTWSKSTVLQRTDEDDLRVPGLAFDPAGTAHLAFGDFSAADETTLAIMPTPTLSQITTPALFHPKLAFTPGGNPALVFREPGIGNSPQYGERKGGSWSFETIVSPARDQPVLTFDPFDRPAVAWSTGGNVKLAEKVPFTPPGGSPIFVFSTSTVDPSTKGDAISVTYLNDGSPAVAYVADDGSLFYSQRNADNSWSRDLIDDCPNIQSTGTGVLPTGHSFVAYTCDSGIYFAVRVNNIWTVTLAVPKNPLEGFPQNLSLAIGPDGLPGMAYQVVSSVTTDIRFTKFVSFRVIRD